MSVHYVYVLKLENGYWYVGETKKHPLERFKEHQEGKGSRWTKLHKPIEIHDYRIVDTLQKPSFIEALVTYQTMWIYGMDNVRGGPFTDTGVLTTAGKQRLEIEIGHYLELEFSFVRKHFASDLFRKRDVKYEEEEEDYSIYSTATYDEE